MAGNRFIPRERLAEVARYDIGSLSRGKAPAPGAAASGAGAGAADAKARERAEEEGRNAGYAAGLAEGRAHAQRIAALAQRLEQAVAQFEPQAADALAGLALAVARQMLKTDVEGRRNALVAVLRESLAALPDGLRRPLLILHPADVALVRAQLGDALERGNWALVEDHRVEPGGCRLDAAEAGVDATLATRWARVCAALGAEGTWTDG